MIFPSVSAIRHTIHQRLEQEQYICVFPTETAAKFWADDYVSRGSTGILRIDRVMAWDRFKALFLPVREQQPTNAIIRHLFALGFLQDIEQSAALQWFRYLAFPDSSENLSGAIARLLPRLDDLQKMRLERPEVYGRLPQAYCNDVERIDMAYRRFLQEHELFEPQFLHPSMEHLAHHSKGLRYAVFFPEVCTGWEEFAAMDPFPECLEEYAVDASQARSTIAWFPNELMELKTQLDTIEQLLDSGTSWEDIIITVGDSKRWSPYLLHEATLRDIPLNIVEGLSPVAYAPGRFLQAIGELHTHRFSLHTMKAFLLDPRYPFKDRPLLRSLIERGLEYSVVMGAVESRDDGWSNSLSLSSKQDDKKLLQWYINFKRLVLAVVRSSTVDALLKGIFAFQEYMLEEDSWSGIEGQSDDVLNASIYAYCLDYLGQVQKNLQACGIGGTSRLFSLFLQFLERQRYIPRERKPGIPVYSYTVSVGICCDHHFLLGCTEDVTRLRSDLLPLVPESVWKDDDSDKMTTQFIDHYRLAGEQVYWSCAQSAFGGTSSLAPAWFIDNDAVEHHSYTPTDAIHTERLAWLLEDTSGWKPRSLQSRWFFQAQKTAYVPPRFDLAESRPAFSLWNRFSQPDGTLRVSSTNLDTFTDCPMKWASRYLFQLEKGEYELQVIDHRQVGIILHTILERFFREVTRLTHTYRGDLTGQYTEILCKLAAEEFASYAASPKAPGKTTIHYLQERYTEQLLAIVQAEAKQFNDYVSEAFEQKLEYRYPEFSYTLEGRIDRILVCSHDDGSKTVAVVDYKKNLSGKKSDYDDFSEAIPSHQLPIYAKLIHDTAEGPDNGEVVGVAAFYDIGKGSYRVIWKEGEDEKREGMIDLVERKIGQMIESLREGKLGTTNSSEPCTRCDYRQICRRRYALV